jgi:hypothetical protein
MPYAQAHQPDHGPTPRADFRITYHGTITTITPLTEACREWVEENVAIEPWQRFGPSIAIEPRYVEQVAEAMIEAGLFLEDDDPSEED